MGFFRNLRDRGRAAMSYTVSEMHKRAGALPPEVQKQATAVKTIVANLYEATLDPKIAKSKGSDAPMVLNFRLPDSRLRYLQFCLSTVFFSCGHKMTNPDAVLNDCFHSLTDLATTDRGPDGLLTGPPVDPQKVADDGTALVTDFLSRWSAYIEFRGLREAGSAEQATKVIVAMLRMTESKAPAAQEDIDRLWPLARWIEGTLGSIPGAFGQASR